MVEYLLSQDFVDKTICNGIGEHIYHLICKIRIRGADELFSIIEKRVPHHLLLKNSNAGRNAFHIACGENNIFIVKRLHEILEALQLDFTSIKKDALKHATGNEDIEVIKYVLTIDGIQLNDDILYASIGYLLFEVVVYFLNLYLCQSIPSHLHNQFHIFQFSNRFNHHSKIEEEKKEDFNRKDRDDNDDNNYLKIFEENFKNLMEKFYCGKRIWHDVSRNGDLDVVQLIFSLKGIQPEILNISGMNIFLRACETNPNIKVIKYIHKLFPSFIHSEGIPNGSAQNGAHLVVKNFNLTRYHVDSKLDILHYLYLNEIDIHLITNIEYQGQIYYESIYSKSNEEGIYDENIVQYLKVISQDFDYQNNEHDDVEYRKPSFWKEFNNNNNNNNNIVDEQSKRVNEWKNRFDEHVLHYLSKMIQQHMLEPNES